MKKIKAYEWAGCYPSKWKGMIIDEAMGHPAKFSNKLIRRIYEHMRSEGWIKVGDYVLDPFAGVALGALDAMRLGLNWCGNELEPRFVDLGKRNIELWNQRFMTMPGWGQAILLQGDSRKLSDIIHDHFAISLSSPPYAETRIGRVSGQGQAGRGDQYGDADGQLGAMVADQFDAAVASPPFLQARGGDPEPKPGGVIDKALKKRHSAGNMAVKAYGAAEGQMGNMVEGDFGAAVSSPPYSGMQVAKNSKSIDRRKQYETYKKSGGGQTYEAFCRTQELHSQEYGQMEGQMDNMPNGDFDASVTSPPYNKPFSQSHNGSKGGKRGTEPSTDGAFVKYGNTDGQIEGQPDDDFWLAARKIVEQVYLCLAPGGHAVWVCKDFVKNHERVPFCDNWRKLCEAVGFVTVHEHHALLVHSTSVDFDGKQTRKESKGFFRRIAEKNGSPRIDYEVIFCMVK